MIQEEKNKNLLFAGLYFYLNTEVPRQSLEFIILALGGKVDKENNHSEITHVITDRENILKDKKKEYVQPQWIYDSVNFAKLLNVKEYAIGKVYLCLMLDSTTSRFTIRRLKRY